ncbi:hypothetical protein Pint_28866 [Pistacia integerrima]|uniref:Uncharacterized protein n=1 Tax=Pistacia integerrima TaxID=434235 RepID=A0ACC0X3R5_9ROSI|nr:hypothetical protein Pint_28866 [Pistacia integerrima]
MGKVHGSLARAGKVRGQTPKVAKQDKKKKPRGRAHKRMQYNRRFVTAVLSASQMHLRNDCTLFGTLENGEREWGKESAENIGIKADLITIVKPGRNRINCNDAFNLWGSFQMALADL